MAPAEIMRGSWRSGQQVSKIDQHTELLEKIVNDVPCFVRGIASYVRSLERAKHEVLALGITRMGMHSLWYAYGDGEVLWDEYRWRLTDRSFGRKVCAPRQVQAGFVVMTNGYKHIEREVQPETRVSVKDTPLDESVEQFVELAREVVSEIYELAGRPKITALLSAGTDSTLGTCLLRDIGADIHAITVGLNEEYFDPKYAINYAKQLDIPHTLIRLPETVAEQDALARRTISVIETCEMSNTLMAMCSTMVREWAVENDRPCLWHGHAADDLVGLSNITHGSFRKKHPNGTAQQWSDYRAGLYQNLIPNDMQVARVSRVDGFTFWRSLFYHPKITDFVWSRGFDCVPLSMDKPLYEGACDKWIAGGSWHVEDKKVGYYSGSGISKIRLASDVFKDENLRAIYKEMKRG